MITEKFKVSIIIPSRADEDISKTVDKILESGYQQKKIEILNAVGNQPSVQRNKCAEQASGDIIYFLDNDSEIQLYNDERKSSLHTLLEQFESHPKAIVGGPSLTPSTDSWFQKGIGLLFSSVFGVGKIRSRYTLIGKTRLTDQTEIILCNMMIDRKSFKELGGFNENLYPNEENDLVFRMQKLGGEIVHVPSGGVYRSQRETLGKFIKQIFVYGRGRAEQTLANPKSFSSFVIIVIGFLFYAVLAAPVQFLLWNPLVSDINGSELLKLLWNYLPLAPGVIYLFFNILFSLGTCISKGKLLHLPLMPFLYFINHIMYGVGFFFGLFKRGLKLEKKKEINYTVRKIKTF